MNNKENRTISLHKEINKKLGTIKNASGLIEELLIKHFELQDEQDMTSDEKIKKWTIELAQKQLEVEMKQKLEQKIKEIENGNIK